MSSSRLHGSRVLVTGGAGFIGSHLVDGLLAEGARVSVLDNLATGRMANLEHCLDRIDFVEGDIRDLDVVRRATAGCSVVFHQAALGSVPRSIEDPATSFEVNVQGTVNVFSAAREAGVESLIYASSSSVYGDSPSLPKVIGEEGRPLSPYAASKQMNEQIAQVFASSYGLAAIGLRYFNIYGARQDPAGPYAAVIPRFFDAALEGRPVIIYGDGEQSRDFTHVADAVRANLLAVEVAKRSSAATFNVAAGAATSVRDLAQKIGRLCRTEHAPVHEAPRAGDVQHSLADLELTTAKLGYQPSVSLDEGLAASLNYYRTSLEQT